MTPRRRRANLFPQHIGVVELLRKSLSCGTFGFQTWKLKPFRLTTLTGLAPLQDPTALQSVILTRRYLSVSEGTPQVNLKFSISVLHTVLTFLKFSTQNRKLVMSLKQEQTFQAPCAVKCQSVRALAQTIHRCLRFNTRQRDSHDCCATILEKHYSMLKHPEMLNSNQEKTQVAYSQVGCFYEKETSQCFKLRNPSRSEHPCHLKRICSTTDAAQHAYWGS